MFADFLFTKKNPTGIINMIHSCRVSFGMIYTDMENIVTWLMTFGAKAEVLEPTEARDIIRGNTEETL